MCWTHSELVFSGLCLTVIMTECSDSGDSLVVSRSPFHTVTVTFKPSTHYFQTHGPFDTHRTHPFTSPHRVSLKTELKLYAIATPGEDYLYVNGSNHFNIWRLDGGWRQNFSRWRVCGYWMSNRRNGNFKKRHYCSFRTCHHQNIILYRHLIKTVLPYIIIYFIWWMVR